MTKQKTPAPRRAGTATRPELTLDDVRAMLRPIAHDLEAMEVVARLAEVLAERSPRRLR